MVKKTKKLVVSKSKKEEVKKLPKPKKTSAKVKKLTAEEKYWNEVDQLAQQKIYHLFTTNLPFQNIPLIKEPWKYEEDQLKKVGLFLRKDADYHTLLFEYENNCSSAEYSPQSASLAEQIAYDYLLLVVKSLLRNLSGFDCHLGFEELYE